MTAFNVVRMRVRPNREDEFLEINRNIRSDLLDQMRQNGLQRAFVVKTGEHAYCFIGEWESLESIVKSRPDMIINLDRMRDTLENLGDDMGVTDPVSGEAVIELSVETETRPRTRKLAKSRAVSAKRGPASRGGGQT